MKKSMNLALTSNETKEAIFEYLKRKNICIPEDANIDFDEDNYDDTYAYVSYFKDVDKAEDKSQISIDVYSNENSYDVQNDPIKEILDIDSQPMTIKNAYFYLRSINYFNREVTNSIISKDKDTIDNTINLMKRIAHADVEKIVNDYSRR